MYHNLRPGFFNRIDSCPGLQKNPKLLSATGQSGNEVGIEAFEHPPSSMKNGHPRSGAGSDVAEFHRDIAAADKNNLRRKLLKLHELRAVDQMFRSGDMQACGLCTSGDNNKACIEPVACDFKGICINKLCPPMETLDANFLKRLFLLLRHWISKRPLEANQFRPVDRELAFDCLLLAQALR